MKIENYNFPIIAIQANYEEMYVALAILGDLWVHSIHNSLLYKTILNDN